MAAAAKVAVVTPVSAAAVHPLAAAADDDDDAAALVFVAGPAACCCCTRYRDSSTASYRCCTCCSTPVPSFLSCSSSNCYVSSLSSTGSPISWLACSFRSSLVICFYCGRCCGNIPESSLDASPAKEIWPDGSPLLS